MPSTELVPPAPQVLSPVTPAELLIHIINHHRHPTTVVVASPRQPFLDALALEVGPRVRQHSDEILPKTLIQTAVSRHIRLVFAPTPTHLRAYLATFSDRHSHRGIVPDPPPATHSSRGGRRLHRHPLLLVYAFLEIHRLTSEWSAQGIAATAATLVEAAARTGFRAAVVEPRGGGGGGEYAFETLDQFLREEVPLLNGARRRDDTGDWIGRTVDVASILGRWFDLEPGEEGGSQDTAADDVGSKHGTQPPPGADDGAQHV
ncbi:hypothetical protein GMORB2_0631 [Geosmithia morbida]|uniref:Uncharacterized protein n=1 Tax=Geosmithia morbida TaxID=1094350 RepID=A0A9P4Z3R8_9HYPO|nr:uncharacterized protein GMORB2_0631 [Geosmithia morbida]KAF4126894.1 hypothetical protein GMORB2_0631 [Geosmithia morbida]